MTDASRAAARRFAAGRDAATGRRRLMQRRGRVLWNLVVRLLLRHRRWDRWQERTGQDVRRLRWVPEPVDAGERADLQARWAWYLSDLGLPPAVSWYPAPATAAPWMAPSLVEAGGKLVANGVAEGTSAALVHRVTIRSLVEALRGEGPVVVVDDDHFDTTGILGFERVREVQLGVPAAGALRSAVPDGTAASTALVVATGPSLAELDLATVTHDVRITCNSAVRDRDLLLALDPQLIAFADPVFHFGPSVYAATFREDVERALEFTNAHLLIPRRYAMLLVHHMSSAADRIVPIESHGLDWIWPATPDEPFRVRGTDNILTFAMLPAAFAVADHVDVAGSTGRHANERYFWQHNPATQYSDSVMETAYAAHRSFFRDRMYGDYYARHCEELEELIRAAEARGKTVRSITSSWIPALRDREGPIGNG